MELVLGEWYRVKRKDGGFYFAYISKINNDNTVQIISCGEIRTVPTTDLLNRVAETNRGL